MSTLAGTAYSAESVPTRIGFGRWAVRAVALLRGIGPYAAIEILLPGGTLFALLLWLYRRYKVEPRFEVPDRNARPIQPRNLSRQSDNNCRTMGLVR